MLYHAGPGAVFIRRLWSSTQSDKALNPTSFLSYQVPALMDLAGLGWWPELPHIYKFGFFGKKKYISVLTKVDIKRKRGLCGN